MTNLPEEYGLLLIEARERIRTAQYRALRAANRELIGLYLDIGRMIVERQAGDTRGRSNLQPPVGDRQMRFPGVGGFLASNLWRMKSFFEAYAGSGKLAQPVREIGLGRNRVILERCSDPLEREFYIRMTRKFDWTWNVLIHQIENQGYGKNDPRPGGDRGVAGGWGMRGIRSRGDVPAIYAAQCGREFVQRRVARIRKGDNTGPLDGRNHTGVRV